MAATRRELQRDRARFVYVTRFGSHQCGGVLPLGGRRAQGPRHAGLKDGHRQEKPRAAAPAIPGAAELPLCFRFGPSRPAPPRGVERAERAQAGGACRGSGWLGGRGPRAADASTRLSLTQKNLAKKFDFPIPLSETSKIMKKNKKVLVWNGVYKVISKMLKENEKYRLRLKCQQLSSESKYTQFSLY
uniref:Uncharacterized protein n=1 Tax=Rangifer tarandus platyrhynchus TaxID=3082113 RepID=A0ACB0E4P4_RANTA|nr:unnamed protein product [Rangifer tarandus platyrhynchus]